MDVHTSALQIVEKLNQAGYVAYFAGGWVRDYLMNYPSDDIDIATDAPPEKIVDLFPKTLCIGMAFGVVVVIHYGRPFEVATFRRDVDYVDGRRPSYIELSTAQEDALRRDFTINGMFYDPINKHILDYVEGQEDIKRKVIRTIGDPYERFQEDRLRMVRAVRFSARYDFPIEENTKEAICNQAHTLFPSVAVERVWQELLKMSKAPTFDSALIKMYDVNLLSTIFPSLSNCGIDEIKRRVSGFKHFHKSSETILYLMELFPDIHKDQVKQLCLFLKTSNKEAASAEFLLAVRHQMDKDERAKNFDLYAWVYLYSNPLFEKCLEVVASKKDPEERKALIIYHKNQIKVFKHHIERIIKKKPLVNAELLEKGGVKPGKLMGMLLKEAEKMAILYDLDDPEKVLDILKQGPNWPKER